MPIQITEVSGSFIFGINDALQKLACPPEISHWFYWDWNLLHARPTIIRDVLPIDAQARRQSLLDADVVILEENEASGPHSGHGELMMQRDGDPHADGRCSATTPAASPPPPPR